MCPKKFKKNLISEFLAPLLRPHVMGQFFGGIFNVILRLKIAKSLIFYFILICYAYHHEIVQ